jgi:Zn-dependent metalloprotease
LNGQSSLTFETESNPNNTAQFRLSAYNNALNTKMAVNGNSNWTTLPDAVNNNGANWTANTASRNAQTAHWLTQRMHQMMQQNLGRNGLNGQGLYPRVTTDLSLQNAGWTNTNLNGIVFGNIAGV